MDRRFRAEQINAGDDSWYGEVDGHRRLLRIIVLFIDRTEKTVTHRSEETQKHTPKIDICQIAEIAFRSYYSCAGEREQSGGQFCRGKTFPQDKTGKKSLSPAAKDR